MIKAHRYNSSIINTIIKTLVFLFLFGYFHIKAQNTSVMTFNIRYDNPNDKENSWQNRKNELIALIEYYHPDFLGVQEALYNQVQFIQNNCSNYNYIGIGRDGADKGEYSAIYYDTTKYVLIKEKTFWLSNSPDSVSKAWDAALNRICTYGKFMNKKSKQVIYLMNTHFDHKGINARINSAKLIADTILNFAEDEKIVLMGDFNALPQSKPINILNNVLKNAFLIAQKKPYGPIGTFNGFDNIHQVENQIDYIFVKNLMITKYRHIDDKRKNNLCVSDHFPVFAEIQSETH